MKEKDGISNNIKELEQAIIEKFKYKGWDIRSSKPCNDKLDAYADFTIFYENKLYGYVDILYYKHNKKLLIGKLEQEIKFIKEIKPLLFIVTDGISYHVSINGGLFEEQHFVPDPDNCILKKSLNSDYVKSFNSNEKVDDKIYGSLLNMFYNKELSNNDKIKIINSSNEKSQRVNQYIKEENISSSIFNHDKELLNEKCETDYGKLVWHKLSTNCREDIISAYFITEIIPFCPIKISPSNPIGTLTLATELEIKEKLFIPFANEYKNKRLKINNKDDDIFNNSLYSYFKYNDLSLTLIQMLTLIKYSYSFNSQSNYALELRKFLDKENWNTKLLYSKIDDNYYIDYGYNFRNPSHHSRIYNFEEINKCKKETIKVLSWFVKSENI